MRLSKSQRSHSVVFNLTPMIDIVFLLIIFFMTVSQITRVIDQPMSLPLVESGATGGHRSTVTININRDGQIVVSGKTIPLDRTIQILQGKLEQLDNDVTKLTIELRCDKRCPGKYVNRIIEQLSEIGIPYVKIAVAGEN